MADDELVVSRGVRVPRSELTVRFSTSGGPGGQHANKTATRVEVVFDVEASPSLLPVQRERVLAKLGPVIRIVVDDERSQLRNRALAEERFVERLAAALHVERPRRATKPSKGAKERRLQGKKQRSETKANRRPPRALTAEVARPLRPQRENLPLAVHTSEPLGPWVIVQDATIALDVGGGVGDHVEDQRADPVDDTVIALVPPGRAAWAERVRGAYDDVRAPLWRALVAWSGSIDVADEAVAEAFAQLLRRGDEVRDPAAWAWRSAFRIAAGDLKRRRLASGPGSRSSEAALALLPATADRLPDDALDLVRALAQLSDQQRRCIALVDVAGHTAPSAADVLGTTAATVRVQLMRARRHLRTLLADPGDTAPAPDLDADAEEPR